MDLNMPVTIVVKAPNQKIDDQTVECALGWTVKKLKQHLSDVYPSQPKEDQQRIIYSGKLLHDHLKLKDILRRDDLGITHTMHLVCSSTDGTSVADSTASLPSSQSTPDVGNLSSESSFTPTALPDGLRNRMSHIQTQPNLMAYQHAFSHFHHHQQTSNGHHYNPQQMAWMQQMYAQQMAQYMQYLQHSAVPPSPTSASAHGLPAQAAPAAPQRAPVQNAAANQNMRMNAQGGPIMDDDEDEGVRDWLDWVYVMSRAAVLFAILYFYSTFGRFMIVFGLFVLVWIYNTGLFRIRRRAQRNEQERVAQEPPIHQQVQQGQQQQQQQQQQQTEEVDGQSSEDDENSRENSVPEIPPRPGVVKILMTFFWTFLTSLFPENQQMVNN